MRSLKNGLMMLAAAGLCGSMAVVGCSASGSGVTTDESSPTEPAPEETGNTLPPSQGSSSGDTAAVKDAGKTTKDAGKTDAAKDAGPPPPTPGDPCTTANEIKSKSCGKCGIAETACIGGVWTDYGVCTGETGACVPGTTTTEACGNCGTLTQTCNQYCENTASSCAGEPANSCVPGTVTYSGAGCGAGTYRSQTCSAACTQGNLAATCAEPVNANKLVLGTTVSAIVTGTYTLAAAVTSKRPYDCGGTLGSTSYPYVAVEIKNPNATQATVAIYDNGTPVLDTYMWIYDTAIQPMNDTQLLACNTTYDIEDSCGTNNFCGNPSGSTYKWAGIEGVKIPAGGKVLVYTSAYTATNIGDFKLSAKVTAL